MDFYGVDDCDGDECEEISRLDSAGLRSLIGVADSRDASGSGGERTIIQSILERNIDCPNVSPGDQASERMEGNRSDLIAHLGMSRWKVEHQHIRPHWGDVGLFPFI